MALPRTEPDRDPRRVGIRGAVSAGVLVAFIAAALTVIAGHDGTILDVDLETVASEVGAPLPPEPPEIAALPDLPDPPEAPADATPRAPIGGPREPTAADASAFTTGFRPDNSLALQSIAIDLDGNGLNEVLVASITGGVVRLDVAVWDGQRYVVVFTDPGGRAETLDSFTVRDVTGDRRREIVTEQTGRERQSITLWGVAAEGVGPEGGIVRLDAQGGCWNGSHVYGITGASVGDGELVATCDPGNTTDLVPGGQHRYTWDGQAWIHQPPEAP